MASPASGRGSFNQACSTECSIGLPVVLASATPVATLIPTGLASATIGSGVGFATPSILSDCAATPGSAFSACGFSLRVSATRIAENGICGVSGAAGLPITASCATTGASRLGTSVDGPGTVASLPAMRTPRVASVDSLKAGMDDTPAPATGGVDGAFGKAASPAADLPCPAGNVSDRAGVGIGIRAATLIRSSTAGLRSLTVVTSAVESREGSGLFSVVRRTRRLRSLQMCFRRFDQSLNRRYRARPLSRRRPVPAVDCACYRLQLVRLFAWRGSLHSRIGRRGVVGRGKQVFERITGARGLRSGTHGRLVARSGGQAC